MYVAEDVNVDEGEEWRYRKMDGIKIPQLEKSSWYSNSHWVSKSATDHRKHGREDHLHEILFESKNK